MYLSIPYPYQEQREAKLQAKKKKQLESEDMTECTFKPKTNQSVVPYGSAPQRLLINTVIFILFDN
jgi:hypothetical protein